MFTISQVLIFHLFFRASAVITAPLVPPQFPSDTRIHCFNSHVSYSFFCRYLLPASLFVLHRYTGPVNHLSRIVLIRVLEPLDVSYQLPTLPLMMMIKLLYSIHKPFVSLSWFRDLGLYPVMIDAV